MVNMMVGRAWSIQARGAGEKAKVFDWHKAADILREQKAQNASAGLHEDFMETQETILRDGVPVPADKANTYLASMWATPVLVIDGYSIPCWRFEDDLPEPWGRHTCWPESALTRFNNHD